MYDACAPLVVVAVVVRVVVVVVLVAVQKHVRDQRKTHKFGSLFGVNVVEQKKKEKKAREEEKKNRRHTKRDVHEIQLD